jgi:hypothetical protein
MELDGNERYDVREALRLHRDTLLAELAHADQRPARGILRDRVQRSSENGYRPSRKLSQPRS